MKSHLGVGIILLMGLLLTGALTAAEEKPCVYKYIEVTAAEEKPCDGSYKDVRVTPAQLDIARESHRKWLANELSGQRANLCGANLEDVNLRGACLSGADLRGVKLQKVDLGQADLRGAQLAGANLAEADLRRADLRQAKLDVSLEKKANWCGVNLCGVNLWGVDLRGANLRQAKLVEADLRQAHLEKANLEMATLQSVLFEPVSLPDLRSIASAIGLSTLRFEESPQALQDLREAFKKAGYRQQERESTYALWHTQRVKDWDGTITQKVESLFKLVLFEWPCAYGMHPWRPFQILSALIVAFAGGYGGVLWKAKSRAGIWASAELPYERRRTKKREWRALVTHRSPKMPTRGVPRLRAWLRTCRIALYFSLLSAFHLGWQELNVGTWLTRMQGRPYILSATGWVRAVSGFQSLLSVYLLALWTLTYFGRPFEG